MEGDGAERKVNLVAEAETRGGVYVLNGFNGKLLAGINSKVRLCGLHYLIARSISLPASFDAGILPAVGIRNVLLQRLRPSFLGARLSNSHGRALIWLDVPCRAGATFPVG